MLFIYSGGTVHIFSGHYSIVAYMDVIFRNKRIEWNSSMIGVKFRF